MVRALDVAFGVMGLAITAVVLLQFPHELLDSGTCTSTTATTTHTQVPTTSSAEVLLPLAAAATVALFAAVALVFRHLHHAGGERRLSELITFMLCASAAILQHVVFGAQPTATGIIVTNVGERVRALGAAAARMLPMAATVTFFLGVALALVHVRSGGGGAVAGDDPVARVLSKMALEAAAVLIGLMMSMVLCTW